LLSLSNIIDRRRPVPDANLWARIRARPGHPAPHGPQSDGPDEPGHDGVGTAQVTGQGRWYNIARSAVIRFSVVPVVLDILRVETCLRCRSTDAESVIVNLWLAVQDRGGHDVRLL
jgi:hypothetical protein